MAVTHTITRIAPLLRNAGQPVPNLIPLGQWVDAVVLAGGTAQSYAVKTDASGNKGTFLRVSASVGPVYANTQATATVPGATTTDGSSSICLNPQVQPVLLAMPLDSEALSLICANNTVVTIEAWS
jgi:hypothetical protein